MGEKINKLNFESLLHSLKSTFVFLPSWFFLEPYSKMNERGGGTDVHINHITMRGTHLELLVNDEKSSFLTIDCYFVYGQARCF